MEMLITRTCCRPDQHEQTARYLCGRWNIEREGETMFYDEGIEVAFAVSPRPGRLVVFDRRAGRSAKRICYPPRYTFAIKFERMTQG
jgi:hypothetical protein